MKDYTKEMIEVMRDQLVAIDESGYTSHAHVELESIQEAADRLNALVQPTWYYPEKGELPAGLQAVWVWLGNEDVEAMIFNNSHPNMHTPYFNPLVGYTRRDLKEVYAWTPYIVPAPPVDHSFVDRS